MRRVEERIYELSLDEYSKRRGNRGKAKLLTSLYGWVFNGDVESLLAEIDLNGVHQAIWSRENDSADSLASETNRVAISPLLGFINTISNYDPSNRVMLVNSLKQFIMHCSNTDGSSTSDQYNNIGRFIGTFTSVVKDLFGAFIQFEDYSLWFDVSSLKQSEEFRNFLALILAYVNNLNVKPRSWPQLVAEHIALINAFCEKLNEFAKQNLIFEVTRLFMSLGEGNDAEHQRIFDQLKREEFRNSLLLQDEEVKKLTAIFTNTDSIQYSLSMQIYFINRVFLHAMLVSSEETSEDFKALLDLITRNLIQDYDYPAYPWLQINHIAKYPLRVILQMRNYALGGTLSEELPLFDSIESHFQYIENVYVRRQEIIKAMSLLDSENAKPKVAMFLFLSAHLGGEIELTETLLAVVQHPDLQEFIATFTSEDPVTQQRNELAKTAIRNADLHLHTTDSDSLVSQIKSAVDSVPANSLPDKTGVDSRLMFKFLALAGSLSMLCGIILLSIGSGNVAAGAATLVAGAAALVGFGIYSCCKPVDSDSGNSKSLGIF